MLLANAFPYLNAYHAATGFAPDEIEDVARRAWAEGAAPQAVLRDSDGSWRTWREIGHGLEPDVQAKVVAEVSRRIG